MKKPINKILIVALHVFGWALLFMLPFRFLSRGAQFSGERMERIPPPLSAGDTVGGIMHFHEGSRIIQTAPLDPTWFRVESIVTNCLLAIFFYTNMFVLVPKVLNLKGWKPYALLVLSALALYLFAGYFIRLNFIPEGIMIRPGGPGFSAGGSSFFVGGPPFFIGIPNFLMVFGLSLALRIMQDRSAMEAVLKEQENEKLKSELSFLRSQVSPHFMFNVLNSLASLARKKSDDVEPAIIQLSQLMRYSLYHTDKKVTLDQEAEYLGNYIELQRLRFGGVVKLHFHVNIKKKDIAIEPMLLVPFVENAFKHGVGLMDDPIINISLEGNTYGINFTVRNKFDPNSVEVKDGSSGIGIQNVKRRLDLLYKDMYTLKIYKNEENWFITELNIIAT